MGDGIDWDTVFSLLGDEHRRRLLISLLEYDRVSIPEDVRMGDEKLEQVQLRMRHVHLPKLEAAGYVAWNLSKHEVETGPNFEEIRPILESVRAHHDDLPTGWIDE